MFSTQRRRHRAGFSAKFILFVTQRIFKTDLPLSTPKHHLRPAPASLVTGTACSFPACEGNVIHPLSSFWPTGLPKYLAVSMQFNFPPPHGASAFPTLNELTARTDVTMPHLRGHQGRSQLWQMSWYLPTNPSPGAAQVFCCATPEDNVVQPCHHAFLLCPQIFH